MGERYLKQAIVVRTDLNMNAGKAGAMIAHASRTFILERLHFGANDCAIKLPDQPEREVRARGEFSADEHRWMTELDPGIEATGQRSMATIVLQVHSEGQLLEIEQKAKDAGLTVHRVIDSGYSHNPAGTFVCIAIGPHWPEQLDPVTGKLSTFRVKAEMQPKKEKS